MAAASSPLQGSGGSGTLQYGALSSNQPSPDNTQGGGSLTSAHPDLPIGVDDGGVDASMLERKIRVPDRKPSWWIPLALIILGAAAIGVPFDPNTERMSRESRNGMQMGGAAAVATGLALGGRAISNSRYHRHLPIIIMALGTTLASLGIAGAVKTDNLDASKLDHLGVMALLSFCAGLLLVGGGCHSFCSRV